MVGDHNSLGFIRCLLSWRFLLHLFLLSNRVRPSFPAVAIKTHQLIPQQLASKSSSTMKGNFARRGGKVHSSSQRITLSPSPSQRRPGLGLGKGIAIRRRTVRLARDTILGITKNDIRRLARRGGVKRISAGVYDTARAAMRAFLKDVFCIFECC